MKKNLPTQPGRGQASRTPRTSSREPSWPIRRAGWIPAAEPLKWWLCCVSNHDVQVFIAADRWSANECPSGDGVVARCGWGPTSQSRRLAASERGRDGKVLRASGGKRAGRDKRTTCTVSSLCADPQPGEPGSSALAQNTRRRSLSSHMDRQPAGLLRPTAGV